MPSPKFQTKPVAPLDRLLKLIELPKQRFVALKSTTGFAKITTCLVTESLHPLLVLATNFTLKLPDALYDLDGLVKLEVVASPKFQL